MKSIIKKLFHTFKNIQKNTFDKFGASLRTYAKHITVSAFVPVLFLFVFAFAVSEFAPFTHNSEQHAQDPAELVEKIQSADLPVGKVTLHETSDAWGTVVYIPQTHRNPGTDPHERINDSAEVAQNQMYLVISYLTKEMGIRFVMAEGDLYDTIPEQKIAYIRKKIDARNQLAALVQQYDLLLETESVDPFLEKQIIEKANKAIAQADREIILEGAPYRLRAENGETFTLYGSENEETLKEGAQLVRDYVYLKDRMSELQAPQRGLLAQRMRGFPSTSFHTNNMHPLLAQLLSPMNSFMSDINSLKSLAVAGEKIKLANILGKIQQSFKSLQDLNKADFRPQNRTFAEAPLREDNPYKSINNHRKLKSLLAFSEEKIQEVVVDRRNEETAWNLAHGLAEQNYTVGILQFGAGHEEGLIPELQEQGLSVVVITVHEVIERSATAINTREQNTLRVEATQEKIEALRKKIEEYKTLARKQLPGPTFPLF